jgi:hypothetical protein
MSSISNEPEDLRICIFIPRQNNGVRAGRVMEWRPVTGTTVIGVRDNRPIPELPKSISFMQVPDLGDQSLSRAALWIERGAGTSWQVTSRNRCGAWIQRPDRRSITLEFGKPIILQPEDRIGVLNKRHRCMWQLEIMLPQLQADPNPVVTETLTEQDLLNVFGREGLLRLIAISANAIVGRPEDVLPSPPSAKEMEWMVRSQLDRTLERRLVSRKIAGDVVDHLYRTVLESVHGKAEINYSLGPDVDRNEHAKLEKVYEWILARHLELFRSSPTACETARAMLDVLPTMSSGET